MKITMAKVTTDENKINEVLNSRYIEAVFPSKEKIVEMLKAGKQLVFYWGIDPTGLDVHLGHTTNPLLLKKIIALGHKVIMLIGGFTAMIGDPTDKEATRKPLGEEEVKENMKTYQNQIQKILPKDSFELKNNAEWYGEMLYRDWLKIIMKFTVQQMLARDMFQERLKKEKPISVHELMYPIMQGYDSVAMKVDGEIGGNDQTFNMLVGRDLLKEMLNTEKIVITTRLLEDPLTGKKIMNKSEGRYVAINQQPDDMFGKVMAMPDSATLPLFAYTTEVPDEKINEIKNRLDSGENPMTLKKELALELVRMYHGEKAAQKAKENFEKVFSEGKLPEEIEEFSISSMLPLHRVDGQSEILALLKDSGLADSLSKAKDLINEGGVSINNEKIKNWRHIIKPGDVIKVGPRRFLRIIK